MNPRILKETVSIISGIIKEGALSGELNNSENGSYIQNRLNAVRICNSSSRIQGCAATHSTGGSSNLNTPGVVLQNGVMVYDLDNTSNVNIIALDYNGAEEPNTEGDDILVLVCCYSSQGCTGSWFEGGSAPYQKVTYNWLNFSNTQIRSNNKTLFLSLF